ncbi:MAG: hypothetical protein JXA13_06020 [Anaerolineales bacterium]|nr:hypothetical protein [Anaerolineales bacterium]
MTNHIEEKQLAAALAVSIALALQPKNSIQTSTPKDNISAWQLARRLDHLRKRGKLR